MIKKVLVLADETMRAGKHVVIQKEKINDLAIQMMETGKEDFIVKEPEQSSTTNELRIEIIKELIADSINYCYWLFNANIRPDGVNSTMMYENVNQVFIGADHQWLSLESRIHDLIRLLSIHRYPLLEERKRHLLELLENRKTERFVGDIVEVRYNEEEDYFFKLVENFQGFAADPFLKRASLFFIQLYRKLGLFHHLMNILPVPADYQVPKLLHHFGCLVYSDALLHKIQNGYLIPKHSLEEGQIRAGTIVACEILKATTGWNISEIDTYLWTRRKEVTENFHCTITTDY